MSAPATPAPAKYDRVDNIYALMGLDDYDCLVAFCHWHGLPDKKEVAAMRKSCGNYRAILLMKVATVVEGS